MRRDGAFFFGVVWRLWWQRGDEDMRARRVHLRLSEEEYARLAAIERETQRKKQDVLRLLLRQATVSVSPDVTLATKGGSTSDVTCGLETGSRRYEQTQHGGT